MTMRQAENLVSRMTFEECAACLESDSAGEMDQIMLDHMEELDKARFMEFMETF